MRFLTWCNKIDERSDLLFKSAKHFGIEVEPIGIGKEYRGGVSKIEWMLSALDDISENEEIICTDSHDVLYLKHFDDFGTLPWEWGYGSQRRYTHQDESVRWRYECASLHPVYKYLDAGVVSGECFQLRKLYHRIAAELLVFPSPWEQYVAGRAICQYLHKTVVLDYGCELSYCCGGEWRRFAGEVVDGRFRNKRTGTYPYILHAPQWRRSQGIRERVAKELGII